MFIITHPSTYSKTRFDMLRAIHTNKLERMYVKKKKKMEETGIKNKRSQRTRCQGEANSKYS